MTTTAPPATTKTRTKTRYHILRENTLGNGTKTYEPVDANLEASSAAAALKTWANSNTSAETGVYVAIPARQFAPKTITFSKQTVIKVG